MSEHDTISHLPRRPTRRPTQDPTGDAAVDSALADLEALDDAVEPGQQLPVLMAVHEALQHRLSSTEG